MKAKSIALVGFALCVMTACSDADWDHFWNSDAPPMSDFAPQNDGWGGGLYNTSIRSPSACRAAGGTWNTGSGGCWRV